MSLKIVKKKKKKHLKSMTICGITSEMGGCQWIMTSKFKLIFFFLLFVPFSFLQRMLRNTLTTCGLLAAWMKQLCD